MAAAAAAADQAGRAADQAALVTAGTIPYLTLLATS